MGIVIDVTKSPKWSQGAFLDEMHSRVMLEVVHANIVRLLDLQVALLRGAQHIRAIEKLVWDCADASEDMTVALDIMRTDDLKAGGGRRRDW
jgi:hypothetical protein